MCGVLERREIENCSDMPWQCASLICSMTRLPCLQVAATVTLLLTTGLSFSCVLPIVSGGRRIFQIALSVVHVFFMVAAVALFIWTAMVDVRDRSASSAPEQLFCDICQVGARYTPGARLQHLQIHA